MSAPTPGNLQTRIADHLRAQIELGQLKAGERLPTLDKMAADYKCSTVTVRAAVEMLKQQGLVVTQQGRGTFVRERPKAVRKGRDRYSRSIWLTGGKKLFDAEASAQGLRIDPQQMRFIGQVPAPSQAAERLGVEPGTPVHVRKRTTVIEGRPNQLADSYYELDVLAAAPALAADETGPGGGFARLEEAGFHLAEIREEISARMPAGPESVALDLPEGTPVVDLIRTTYDAAGRPVEVMIAVMAGDMVTFDDRFPVPD